MIPVRVCCDVMPDRSGSVIGILYFAIAISPVVLNWIMQIVINPDKLDPYIDTLDNV